MSNECSNLLFPNSFNHCWFFSTLLALLLKKAPTLEYKSSFKGLICWFFSRLLHSLYPKKRKTLFFQVSDLIIFKTSFVEGINELNPACKLPAILIKFSFDSFFVIWVSNDEIFIWSINSSRIVFNSLTISFSSILNKIWRFIFCNLFSLPLPKVSILNSNIGNILKIFESLPLNLYSIIFS